MALEFIQLDSKSDDTQGYKQQYYALRHHAFEHAFKGTNTIYAPQADTYDLLEDTTHCLLVENGKVLAGARLIRHRSGTDTRVKLENDHEKLHLENLLPGVDRKALNYAELSGVVADPTIQDRMLANRLLASILTAYQTHPFDDALILGTANKLSAPIAIRSMKQSGLAHCDSTDTEFMAGNALVRVMMFSKRPDFPFYGNAQQSPSK